MRPRRDAPGPSPFEAERFNARMISVNSLPGRGGEGVGSWKLKVGSWTFSDEPPLEEIPFPHSPRPFMIKRRQFLKAAVTGAIGFQIVPRHVLGQRQTPPSEKLNIAGIGVGGQGGGVLDDLKSQNIVAMCDVDWGKAAHTARAFPNAERFKDYRVMLEKRKDIDAVMHARAISHRFVDKGASKLALQRDRLE